MKKVLLSVIAFAFTIPTFAQEQENESYSDYDFKKNEIKLNLLNTLVLGSIEVGYERFIAQNQSVDAEIFINDRFSYHHEKDGKFKTLSLKAGYNYYFDEEGIEGFYMNPFTKIRIGKYEEDGDNGKEVNMNALILGFNMGYMFNYNDTFIIAPYVSIGRNFSKEVNEEFWAIEPLAGIRVGFRF